MKDYQVFSIIGLVIVCAMFIIGVASMVIQPSVPAMTWIVVTAVFIWLWYYNWKVEKKQDEYDKRMRGF